MSNMPGKHHQSPAVRGGLTAQRGRVVAAPTGQPYRKPVTSMTQPMSTSKLPAATAAAARHGATIGKPIAVGASQPRKQTVYPVHVDLTSPPRRAPAPPPAHGGSGAVRRRVPYGGAAGLDFSKPAAKPRPPPSPPSSDDDVIVLDDSD